MKNYNELPKGTFYHSGKNYSGLVPVEKLNTNVRIGDNVRFSKLKK